MSKKKEKMLDEQEREEELEAEDSGPEDDEPDETPDTDVGDGGETYIEPQPPNDESAEILQQKLKTLMGKYNAEVPRLASEAKQWKEHAIALAERVTQLEQNLKELETQSRTLNADAELQTLVNEYPEIGSYIKKLEENHRKEIAELTKQLDEKLNGTINEVKRDVAITREESFDKAMASLGVPNWREIDNMPEFGQWLSQPADYGRYTKLQLLQDAARALDAKACAKFFLDFIRENPSLFQGSQDDKRNISPSRASHGVRGGSSANTKLTKEMYVEFMRESAKGRFNPAKWGGKTEQQVEAMFDAAIAAGTLE